VSHGKNEQLFVASSLTLAALYIFLAPTTNNPSGVNKVLKRKSQTKMEKEDEDCRLC